MYVIKRDGRKEEFLTEKIHLAIWRAAKSVMGEGLPDDEFDEVVKNILGRIEDGFSVEQIQDIVEDELMSSWPAVAKAFILYREGRRKLRIAPADNTALSEYIRVAKYSKYLPELKRRETWDETVDRVRKMHVDRFPMLTEDIYYAFELVRKKVVLPSMRSMQFAGDPILKHNARMYNCSFTHVDRPEVFGEIMYLLLCGCGVGFSVQYDHVKQLPKLAENRRKNVVRHFAIPDTIEGWGDAITALVDSYVRGYYIEFSYRLIRPEGSPLSSGGKAPGHIPLKEALVNIDAVLSRAKGRQLRPIECYDIICFLAIAVLAGGVRRSSLIALFSAEDDDMLLSKTAENFADNPQRAMANNSVVLMRDCAKKDFLRVMELNRKCFGEPGFYFTTDVNSGTNPCGEIGLYPHYGGFAFCNLTEVNVAAFEDIHELKNAAKVAAFIGTLQAAYSDIPYLGNNTKMTMNTDPLLGIGLTGIMDNLDLISQIDFVPELYEENRRVARIIGIEQASRITCVKPSGTSSLLLGCVGSGIHPHHAKRYFRRVTANPRENVAKHFKKYNPHMVKEKPNGDLCITFPIQCSESARTLERVDEFEFFEILHSVYTNWVLPGSRCSIIPRLSHNVSATIVYEKENFNKILDIIWDKREEICSQTFLEKMSDKGHPFMPREAVIDEVDITLWNELVGKYKPVDYTKLLEADGQNVVLDSACSGGACELIHNEVADFDGAELIYKKDIDTHTDSGVIVLRGGAVIDGIILEETSQWIVVKHSGKSLSI